MKPAAERIEKGLWWDRAWKMVEGCSHVSPGCDHCWSAREANMRANNPNAKIKEQYAGLTEGVRWNGQIRLMMKNLDLPLRVKKPQVWAVWNDFLHPDVPDSFVQEFLFRVWLYRQHTFLLLTKRPERMAGKGQCTNCGYLAPVEDDAKCPTCGVTEKYMREQGFGDHKRGLPDNLWVGTTAENQAMADERIPILLQIPAAVRFVSVEPMLGPVSMRWIAAWDGMATKPRPSSTNELDGLRCLDWVICGGESGPGARPCSVDWIRDIVGQCKAAGVSCFVKQLGSKPRSLPIDISPTGCKLRDKKGADPNEWPEYLRVREMPDVSTR